ncbi:hypothetical protein IFR05_009266, partial [Cadophora sp. M221]
MSEPNISQPSSEKRKKRILTEARKTQNRLAQRAYRQRQKELAKISSGREQLPFRLHELRPRQPRGVGGRCGDEDVCNEATPTTVHASSQLESTSNIISHSHVITGPEQEQANSLQNPDPNPDPINSESIPWHEPRNAEIDPVEIYQARLSTARFMSNVDLTLARRPRPVPWFGTMGIPFADFGDPPSIECAGDPLVYGTSVLMISPGMPQSGSQSQSGSSNRDRDVQNAVLDDRPIGTALTGSILYQDEQ